MRWELARGKGKFQVWKISRTIPMAEKIQEFLGAPGQYKEKFPH